MRISLNVLKHLGINLYSNIPAVLSELVANAWDADAEKVDIWIKPEQDSIIIQDTGDGMNRADINNRYLLIGYNKREETDVITKKHKRHVMGWKGIGKLSVFSIADIIEIYSIKNGEKNAFRMDAKKIKKQIEEEEKAIAQLEKKKGENGKNEQNIFVPYYPDEISTDPINFTKGTKIVLKELKKGLEKSASFSKKRLSRRFSILGDKYKFKVHVNDEEVTIEHRDFYKKIQFVWYLGNESKYYADYCVNATKTTKLKNELKTKNEKVKITGWIGTFEGHALVDVEEDSSSIVLLAHGKLIMEDIGPEFKEGRIFTKYLIGEINADFLDDDRKEDIVTSDRQRIVESDYRWIALKEFIKEEILNKIGNQWTELRNTSAVEEARRYPAIDKWFSKLKGDNLKFATKLFGEIYKTKFADEKSKRELFKMAILAFEKLALTNHLSLISRIANSNDIKSILTVFENIDELEAVHYHEITKGRLDVIEAFKKITSKDTKEKVLQKFIYKHLWLLDPSWDRATQTDSHLEATVNKLFKKEIIQKAKLSSEEYKSRFDLHFVTSARKNIIIELKKSNRKVKFDDLAKQVSKYKTTLLKCLDQKFTREPREFEIICILGNPPEEFKYDKENRQKLAIDNARYVLYDELINNAERSYKKYLEKQAEVTELLNLIESIK